MLLDMRRIFIGSVFKDFYKHRRKFQQSRAIATTKYLRCNKASSVLFFGTDNFSLPSLKALHGYTDNLGVVTSFKQPANCVRLYAEEHKLPLFRWPVAVDDVIAANYSLGVVVSFGHLIPERVIKSFPLGMINVHASMLSRWRGAAPIVYALLKGDVLTGVSIMKIEPKHFDIGDVINQRMVPIKDDCILPELHDNLANQGAELLIETLNNFEYNMKTAKKQNENLVTYAPRITRELTEIDWISFTATDIYRRFRALYGYKNLLTEFQSKTIQLLELKPLADEKEIGSASLQQALRKAGNFCYRRDTKSLIVRCSGDTFIEIYRLRVEGKKAMSALEFNNGFLKNINANQMFFVSKQNSKEEAVVQ